MGLALSIIIVSVISIFIGILWINGIDYMSKNHPDYKGEDLFDENLSNEKKTDKRRKAKKSSN